VTPAVLGEMLLMVMAEFTLIGRLAVLLWAGLLASWT